ncbi:NAD+ synthase [Usitatibacter palustris]|uniref:Glutamine-dependent NAD(+) synthetase n=1 Tax=Usitatibacter palustris TaxID=2732487 RepID=A0A6M4HAR4_9PROT|nr:NAD+ synthase [Usitatibacter palustris]QJR15524.1 Glutamine-dependent NAD(+) synthetase [Usitatibacter palustris]
MKIVVAQINTTVGDFAGNADRIRRAVDEARAQGARLVVTPELALCGYPAEDLLLRDDFCDQCASELQKLATYCLDVGVVVGHLHREGRTRYNAASLLRGGRIEHIYFKQKLPNYSVFDEKRYFDVGNRACVFEVEGTKFGLTICEDLWFPEPARQAKAAGAQVLISINASPFHRNKLAERYAVMGSRVKETGLPLLYVHWTGGQDELVFDGASFALDGQGALTYQGETFRETFDVLEFEGGEMKGGMAPPLTEEETIYRALMTGVRDYVDKNRFPGVILGLSGGVDSALVLAICVDALGADRVHAVMMPSDYTASMSIEDAREMAEIQGVKYTEIAIKPMMAAFREQLATSFEGRAEDATEENLQSRIRGTLLMALSNKFGSIVVTTGNKSEMATGYATLYGDMAGGFAVIKDIVKTLVYRISNWRNSKGRVIPQRVIDRAPSAELRPGQTDQDTLPPYEVLDAVVERFMERDMTPEAIAGMGYDIAAVRQVVNLIRVNEYKRRQAPPGVRITPRGFGKDWRYPITSGFRPKA